MPSRLLASSADCFGEVVSSVFLLSLVGAFCVVCASWAAPGAALPLPLSAGAAGMPAVKQRPADASARAITLRFSITFVPLPRGFSLIGCLRRQPVPRDMCLSAMTACG